MTLRRFHHAATIVPGALYLAAAWRGATAEVPSVTRDEAEQLALLAAKSELERKLPGLHVERTTGYLDPRFYVYEVRWNSPEPVGGTVGFYAIDRKTADVWSALVCREYQSEPIHRLQLKIREPLGMDRKAYEKSRRSGPMC